MRSDLLYITVRVQDLIYASRYCFISNSKSHCSELIPLAHLLVQQLFEHDSVKDEELGQIVLDTSDRLLHGIILLLLEVATLVLLLPEEYAEPVQLVELLISEILHQLSLLIVVLLNNPVLLLLVLHLLLLLEGGLRFELNLIGEDLFVATHDRLEEVPVLVVSDVNLVKLLLDFDLIHRCIAQVVRPSSVDRPIIEVSVLLALFDLVHLLYRSLVAKADLDVSETHRLHGG